MLIKRKHNPTLCSLHETHFKWYDIARLKLKGWKIKAIIWKR